MSVATPSASFCLFTRKPKNIVQRSKDLPQADLFDAFFNPAKYQALRAELSDPPEWRQDRLRFAI